MFSLKQDLQHSQLLYWHHDDALAVHENSTYRWLTMGQTVQSVMALSAPAKPVLPHLHAIAMALFAAPEAKKILELGLGGGALARMLALTHPQSQLTSIESNAQVIHCFEHYFNPDRLPVSLVHGDAGEQLRQVGSQDLLVVDIFRSSRLPDIMTGEEFYHLCLAALNPDGVLCLNLLPQEALLVSNLKALLTRLTGHSPWLFQVPGYRNLIMIGSRQPLPSFSAHAHRLKRFSADYQLDFSQIEPVV